mmetsp:Transcript_109226/g.189305  ORF Transcript_109226/g.189305 Transcript_109226/m.189305 type:complete len:139 (+) Transcript_109226:1567-1983(+)
MRDGVKDRYTRLDYHRQVVVTTDDVLEKGCMRGTLAKASPPGHLAGRTWYTVRLPHKQMQRVRQRPCQIGLSKGDEGKGSAYRVGSDRNRCEARASTVEPPLKGTSAGYLPPCRPDAPCGLSLGVQKSSTKWPDLRSR